MTYVPVGKERFSVEHTARGEQIRVKASKQIFVMLFLPFWLAGWTAGGIAAIYEITREFQLFLLFWLCGWAVGWLFAASQLAWMFTGSETLARVGGDLEIAHHALGYSRRWQYQGSQIGNMAVAVQPAWPYRFRWQIPFFRSSQSGSIRFDYGARSVFAASGLDEAEAALVVQRLTRGSTFG